MTKPFSLWEKEVPARGAWEDEGDLYTRDVAGG